MYGKLAIHFAGYKYTSMRNRTLVLASKQWMKARYLAYGYKALFQASVKGQARSWRSLHLKQAPRWIPYPLPYYFGLFTSVGGTCKTPVSESGPHLQPAYHSPHVRNEFFLRVYHWSSGLSVLATVQYLLQTYRIPWVGETCQRPKRLGSSANLLTKAYP